MARLRLSCVLRARLQRGYVLVVLAFPRSSLPPASVSQTILCVIYVYFTKFIADTLLQTGDIPVRLGPVDKATGKSTVLEAGRPRETRIFDGKTYNMEQAIKGDLAILRAYKVDEEGNCQFR